MRVRCLNRRLSGSATRAGAKRVPSGECRPGEVAVGWWRHTTVTEAGEIVKVYAERSRVPDNEGDILAAADL